VKELAMTSTRPAVTALHGEFRDVLRDADGRVVWDRGWSHNAIVTDFRRLLAAFVRGAPSSADGIVGLQVGAGLPAWDGAGGPPTPSTTQVALVDPAPHLVPRASLQLDFVDESTGAVSAVPTRKLQVRAVLGPGVPAWPEVPPGPHATSTLREFGLRGRLDGNPVLLNYRTHPAIAKDPASTLERTIWLVF
jgi:hypothetical protein